MTIDNFISELEKLGIKLDDKKLNQLERYYELLIEWNEKSNLTGITKKEDVYLKHFYDSLTLASVDKYFLDLNDNIKIIDVGTGAGFPGLVLKIVFPNLQITLLDSLQKRINFLDVVIKELGLTNISTVHARAEEYAKNHREEYDVVTSRAVANLKVLSELCIPMLKVGGHFIPMKANVDEELEESKDILKKLASSISTIKNFNLPIENSVRNIIIIKKLDKTNIKFPRRYSEIKKSLK